MKVGIVNIRISAESETPAVGGLLTTVSGSCLTE